MNGSQLIRHAAVCVLLGVLTCIAVAWLASLALPRFGTSQTFDGPISPGQDCRAARLTRSRGSAVTSYTTIALDYLILILESRAPVSEPELASTQVPDWARPHLEITGNQRMIGRHLTAFGWPCVCLFQTSTSDFQDPTLEHETFEAGHLCVPTLPVINNRPFTLPCAAIPLGLAADSVFYAGVWSILLFAASTVRTHIRRRRNLCPRCAYSRAGLAPNSPCPECGHNPTAA